MATPRDILKELLAPAPADLLDSTGRAAWRAAARALEAALASTPGIEEVEGALVMPEEIVDSFGEPHLVAPIEVSCNSGQTAIAYVTVPTALAAAAFGSQADEPADEEQQTLVVASTALGQVLHAINRDVFEGSSNGLALSLDDLGANGMPAVLADMEDPALLLTAAVSGGASLPVRILLPSVFLEIVASNLDAPVGEMDTPASSADQPASGELDLPFTLSAAELDAAALVEPGDAPAREEPGGPAREPTPISRARFAPLQEPETPAGHSGIDLLAGLRMNVSVELGRTELTVAEVLGLGSGSVIELDRLAGEPVDILVNDRLIARGEVVVVDENFGVRVVEVVRRGSEVEERAV